MLMQIQCDGVSELKKVRDALTDKGVNFEETEGMRLILTPCVSGVVRGIRANDVCPKCWEQNKKITSIQQRIADYFKILMTTSYGSDTKRIGGERLLKEIIVDELEKIRPDRGEEIPF